MIIPIILPTTNGVGRGTKFKPPYESNASEAFFMFKNS